MDRLESLQAPRTRPSSAYSSHRPTINELPRELIVIIFHYCLNSRKLVKVLQRLTLVCQFWKAIIEGTPSFWTDIKAADGLQHVRNAIAKTGESPIDLTLGIQDPVSVDVFLTAVSRKVSRWRSVALNFEALPTSFGGLQTSACHSLEKLNLTWDAEDPRPPTLPLTLFGGGPAPTVLKDVFLHRIPADLAPMRLSKLSSLELIGNPYIMIEDILLLLRNSPMLLTLHLEELISLQVPDGSVGLPILLESLTSCILLLSIPVIRFLLSAIQTPSLHQLELICDLGGSIPTSPPFPSHITSFTPTLQRLLFPAKYVKVTFIDANVVSITFGGLVIALDSLGVGGFQYLRDVLDSLMYCIGERGKDLKMHLNLDAVDPTVEELEIFNRSPMVQQLTVSENPWSDPIPINAINALGTPIAGGPHGWLFPELEVIRWNMDMLDVDELEQSLAARYAQMESTQQASDNGRQHPHVLKEIRFLSKHSEILAPEDWKEMLRRVHVLTRGAKVFFRDSLLAFDTVSPVAGQTFHTDPLLINSRKSSSLSYSILFVNSQKPVKVLRRLTRVCQFWKAIVEGTPSFWTQIKGADGLPYVRNAITKTGESPIDLTLNKDDPVSVAWFLAAVNGKVSCWRSVELTFEALPTSFGGLQTSACHSLEKLSLTWDDEDSPLPTSPLTLFGGGTAPTALKDVFLDVVPIDLVPMRLSKLSSLKLLYVPNIEMDDLLLILRDSPALITLQVQECEDLHVSDGSGGLGLPILLGSLSTCILYHSLPLIRFLLSAIHAPSLDHLELAFNTEDSFPDSSILSPSISRFEPTLKRLLSTAKHIEVKFGDLDFSIRFGGLEIVLDSPELGGFQYFRDVLDSLIRYNEETEKDLKVHLHLSAVNPTFEELQIFNGCPMVEQLTVTGWSWGDSIPINAIEALGNRIAAGPQGWLFPELEVIDWNVNLDIVDKLEAALDKRYFTVQSTQEYVDKHQHPRSLRELRFFSYYAMGTGPVDSEGLRRRLHLLARGAKVFLRRALVDFGTPVS